VAKFRKRFQHASVRIVEDDDGEIDDQPEGVLIDVRVLAEAITRGEAVAERYGLGCSHREEYAHSTGLYESPSPNHPFLGPIYEGGIFRRGLHGEDIEAEFQLWHLVKYGFKHSEHCRQIR
jgi:hypothetical protein